MSAELLAEQVSFQYDARVSGLSQSAHQVLKDFTFEVRVGELTALLGPNGCGKSTLLKLLAGVLNLSGPQSRGRILYRGEEFQNYPPALRARRVAYVGYDFKVDFPMTAFEAVMLGRTSAGSGFVQSLSSQDIELTEAAMRSALCWEWRDRNLQTLSGGERQLVALARGIAQGAKTLLLDESLSQMDLNHQFQVGGMLKELTRKQGWSIVLVSHDVNLAVELADHAVLMKSGEKIAQGSVSSVITEANLKLLYPGAELVVGANPATGTPKVFFSSNKKQSSPN